MTSRDCVGYVMQELHLRVLLPCIYRLVGILVDIFGVIYILT